MDPCRFRSAAKLIDVEMLQMLPGMDEYVMKQQNHGKFQSVSDQGPIHCSRSQVSSMTSPA